MVLIALRFTRNSTLRIDLRALYKFRCHKYWLLNGGTTLERCSDGLRMSIIPNDVADQMESFIWKLADRTKSLCTMS